MFSRRGFLTIAAASLTSGGAQRTGGTSALRIANTTPSKTIEPGEHALSLAPERDGLLIVPKTYKPETNAPLVVLLHGAGGQARRIVRLLAAAEELGIIVLAPDSRGATWDVIRGGFGPDVQFIERALAHTFERCAIDRKRIGIGGFSDGASYALTLGIDNGTFFTHILAFSPGFIAAKRPVGRPRVFVSHGTDDRILPIASTSRRLVPALKEASYAVTYKEFQGPHTVPPAIALDGVKWFLGR